MFFDIAQCRCKTKLSFLETQLIKGISCGVAHIHYMSPKFLDFQTTSYLLCFYYRVVKLKKLLSVKI